MAPRTLASRSELRDGDHAEFTLLERKHRSTKRDDAVIFSTLAENRAMNRATMARFPRHRRLLVTAEIQQAVTVSRDAGGAHRARPGSGQRSVAEPPATRRPRDAR